MVKLGDSFREHVLSYLDAGVRFDGRKLDEFRPISVEYGISHNAEGSARVTVGSTHVLAGVKMAVEKPYPDTPADGNLMINAELLPLSSSVFESGPPSDEAIEVSRIIDRGIRESKVIDTKKLCIIPKEEVWSVMIDICTINVHGNLIDASALASVAALTSAKLPGYEGKVVKYDELTDKGIPLTASLLPVVVTVFKIGKHLIVDPLPEEESVADARISAAVLEDGSIVALQKGGGLPVTAQEIDSMLGLAQAKAGDLRKLLSGKKLK